SMGSMFSLPTSATDCVCWGVASRASAEDKAMKKALIAGGTGFMGFHLSKKLLAEGYHVTACDNGFRGRVDQHVNALRDNARYRLICGDLMDDSCLDAIGCDYSHIFHMAAIVGVGNVVERPYEVLK